VGDVIPRNEVVLEKLDLAPMGTPRPGAGQFYLDTPPGARDFLWVGGVGR